MLCCLTTMMRGVCVVLSHNDDARVCVVLSHNDDLRVCVVLSHNDDLRGVCCVVSQR